MRRDSEKCVRLCVGRDIDEAQLAVRPVHRLPAIRRRIDTSWVLNAELKRGLWVALPAHLQTHWPGDRVVVVDLVEHAAERGIEDPGGRAGCGAARRRAVGDHR